MQVQDHGPAAREAEADLVFALVGLDRAEGDRSTADANGPAVDSHPGLVS
jgi:hypothetical protein